MSELSKIHRAAEQGDLAALEKCIKGGLFRSPQPIDALSPTNETPLHYASKHGHVALVTFLLHNKAAANAIGWMQRTPLHYAARGGHIRVVEVLLNHRADMKAKDEYSRTPLHLAAESNKSEVIKLLIEKGAKLEASA